MSGSSSSFRMIVFMNVSRFVKNLSGINDFKPTYLWGCG